MGVDDSMPYELALAETSGEAQIEATLLTPAAGQGYWRFDFNACGALVPDSLRSETGQLMKLGTREIVFRLNGSAGEQIRLRYRLSQ